MTVKMAMVGYADKTMLRLLKTLLTPSKRRRCRMQVKLLQ